MSKDKALEALNEMYAVLNDSDRWCEHKRIIIEALQSTLDEDVSYAIKVLRRALNEEVFTSRITPNEALDIIVKALQSEVKEVGNEEVVTFKEDMTNVELLEFVMYANNHQRNIGEKDQAYELLKHQLNTPTKSAKEMFEDADCILFEEDAEYVSYLDDIGCEICFDKKTRVCLVDESIDITYKISKAITKQLEEIEND